MPCTTPMRLSSFKCCDTVDCDSGNSFNNITTHTGVALDQKL